MRPALVLVCAWLVTLSPSGAQAHDNAPGVLALEERDTGRFAVAWTPPVDTREANGDAVHPRYPASCGVADRVLDCGEAGLEGLAFDGLSGTRMRVLVVLTRSDGTIEEHLVDGAAPEVTLRGPTMDLSAWVVLGLEHVLGGLDHLAFLLGLLLVSTLDRRLLITITAFTLAHSLTLALSVLGLVQLSAAPVEACIALSVLLLAREALRPEAASLTRRAPWIVAALFGLVHGLGFSGALREVGLPEGSLFSALLGFNLGVELGQLAFVGSALGLVGLARVLSAPAQLAMRAQRLSAYGIGTLGALWLIQRVLVMT